MEVKASDTYRCELLGGLSEDLIVSLMELYQPLITAQGTIVYLTLAAEASKDHTMQAHSRLFSLMGIDPGTFDRACAKLEEYMLLRVYMKEGDPRNNYVYILNVPMSVRGFTSSGIYMNRLAKVMGARQAENTVSRLTADSISTQGFTDITRVAVHRHNQEEEESASYTTVRPNYRYRTDDTTINFDYDKFISSTSSLVYPVELRTRENLALIGKLATVYGLSPDQMRIIVSKCVNLKTMELNTDRLMILAAKTEGEVKKAGDVYSLPPVSFLQAKQNGAAVSMTDKKLIEHLAMDMHFSNEVINVMLEYILNISDNRLNPRFVDMVAGEWARDGIETKEQALVETRKKPKNRQSKPQNVRIDMPEFIRQQETGELPEGTKATSETLAAVKELQKKMKD